MKRGNVCVWIFFQAILLVGCVERGKDGKPLDTPVSGSIKIAVDESLKPLIDAEINVFQGLYTNAHITPLYMAESDAIDALLKDSVRLIIITRRLSKEETGIIINSKYIPHDITVAKEGVALILNKNNPDSLIHFNSLKDIISGKISTWKQLKSTMTPSNIELVFDHPHSGLIRYMHDSVTAFDKLPPFSFAVNSNPQVIDYVSNKKNAIGLIGMSWISDTDDSTAANFLSTIRVAGLSSSIDGEFYQPYQAYIAQGHYPLVREVIITTREARAGLASGFMSFVASDKGQRIILKAGLVPTTMPLRIVNINYDPLVIKQ